MSAMPAPRLMTARDWAMLGLLSMLWGGSFFFIAVAVKGLPPLTIVLLRVAIAAVVLQVALRLLGLALPLTRASLGAFLGMGILNNVIPFSLIVWAQGHIPSGLAAILNGTTPLFTVIVLHVFSNDEKATPLKLAGVVVGFFGVAGMIGLDLFSVTRFGALPQIAMLAAATSYAFSALWGRRFARLGIAPPAAAAGQLTASSLLMLPIALAVEQPWSLPMPNLGVWLAVIALAVASTAFAYVLFFRILANAGATNLQLVTFLIPVSAILLGVVLLGEPLVLRQGLGMLAIGLGLALIDGRLFRRARS